MIRKEGEAWFTTLDMKYAYGQLKLNPELAKHCNFQIIGGNATGTYRVITGFYGLTTMPTEFQKVIDLILARTKNTFAFIDDVLIVTKSSLEKHLAQVRETLAISNEANIGLKWEKCKIAKKEIKWFVL